METQKKSDSYESSRDNKPKKISRRAFLKGSATLAAVVATTLTADKLQQIAQNLIFNKEKMTGLVRVIEEIKKIYPEIDQWLDASEWVTSIINACQKHSVSPTDENIAIILTLIRSSSGFREVPRSYDNLPTPSERTIARFLPVEPKTGGPMEVSYDDVAEKRNLNHRQAVALVDTRDGGIDAGVEKLRKIINLYAIVSDEQLRIQCIFADWNAREGSSQNAGMQRFINKIAGIKIAEDGVRGPQTEMLFEKYRADIEKAHIQPVPAALPVRGLTGVTKKILTGVGNSREYAEKRFQDYLKIKKLIEVHM